MLGKQGIRSLTWKRRLPRNVKQSRRIFIHIGSHKAASTTIQFGLETNRDILSKEGWLYPTSGYVYKGHHNLVWEINNDSRYDPSKGMIEDLIREIDQSGFRYVLLSSEDFENFKKEHIHLLSQRLSGFDIAIIIYLRRQDQFLQSLWSQLVKNSLVDHDFQTWIERILNLNEERLSYQGDYFSLVERWSEIFGTNNVCVRVLETAQLHGHVFIDFLKACGFENTSIVKIPENVNISPSLRTLEIIRHTTISLKKYIRDDTDLFKKIDRFIRHYAERNEWDIERLNLIDHELFLRVSKIFEKSNSKVAKKYLNKEVLFEDGFGHKPLSQFNIQNIDTLEIIDLYSFIIAKLIKEMDNPI